MVKLLERLRKKKSAYVDVDSHSEVSNVSSKSLNEGDREQLGSLSVRSMSSLQKSKIPWTSSNEQSSIQQPNLAHKHARTVDDPIAKIANQLAANFAPNRAVPQAANASRSSPKQAAPPSNNVANTQSLPQKQIHPPVFKEMPKPYQKPASKFEEEALNAQYDLIPTKVRNAPFGRCYFARHRESKNVVLVALILQHVFNRFEGEHGEVQLIELMKSADPNLLGLREKIQCPGSVALVMDITLSEFTKSQTVSAHNMVGSKTSDPSLALDDNVDHRDEEDEIEDFLSELDSTSAPLPWTPHNPSETPEAHTREKMIDSEDFGNGPTSFETYDPFEQRVNKTRKKPQSVEPEIHDSSGRESLRGEAYVPSDSSDGFPKQSTEHPNEPPRRLKSAMRSRNGLHDVEIRDEAEEVNEEPAEKEPMPPTRQKVRSKSVHRRNEKKDKGRRRKKMESSERLRSRTHNSRGTRGRRERRDSLSTHSSDTTSVEPLRPVPPKNLTFWKLLTSLELADCMPLAALDETMDYDYRRSGRRRDRDISRRNTFDTCDSKSYH